MNLLKNMSGLLAVAVACFLSTSVQAGGDEKKDGFELDANVETSAAAALAGPGKTIKVKKLVYDSAASDCPYDGGHCKIKIIVPPSGMAPTEDGSGTFTGVILSGQSTYNDPVGTEGLDEPYDPSGTFIQRSIDVEEVGVIAFGPGELTEYPEGGEFTFSAAVMVSSTTIRCTGPIPAP